VIFWDTSALIRLLVREPDRDRVLSVVARLDPGIAIWWATPVEAESAISRREREGALSPADAQLARIALDRLVSRCAEVGPSNDVRATARRLLRTHALRAADALQLAAALVWAAGNPEGHAFCSTDERLREAASREGFTSLPAA
jgi:predicted nucleic acid-binding protein